jgi:hypothetical protein
LPDAKQGGDQAHNLKFDTFQKKMCEADAADGWQMKREASYSALTPLLRGTQGSLTGEGRAGGGASALKIEGRP